MMMDTVGKRGVELEGWMKEKGGFSATYLLGNGGCCMEKWQLKKRMRGEGVH